MLAPELTQEEAAKKNWEDKSAFSKGISYLSRINYALANATDYALTGGDVIDGAIKGLKGEEETTFSDVLETQNILTGDDVMSKVGKFVVGTGLDIITDPTSYIGIGELSKGVNIASKAASKGASVSSLAIKFAKDGIQPTLSKAGSSAFLKLQTKKAFEIGANKLGKEITEVESMRFMEDAGRLAANEIGEKMLTDSATRSAYEFKKTLTFAGQEIPGISKGFRKALDFTGDAMADTRTWENPLAQGIIKSTDVLRKTADMMFGSGVGAIGNEARVAKLVRTTQNELANKALQQTQKYIGAVDKIFANLTPDVSAQITKALDGGTIDSLEKSVSKVVNGKNVEIPVQKLAKQAQAIYAHLRRREQRLGVATANMWDNYVNHLYGSDLNPMQREAAKNLLKSQTTKGSVGLSNNLQRTYATLEQAAREAGLTPITDIAKLLKARAAASVAATSNKKMMQDLAESVGVKIDPAVIAQKVLEGARASGAKMTGRVASFKSGERDMIAGIQQAYQMTNEGLTSLLTRSTDEIMAELKGGADKAADKFAFSILPKMKYMYGKGENVLDYQKIRAEGLVPFKTSVNTIVKDKNGKLVNKAVEEYHLVPDYIRKNFLEVRGNNYQNQASKDILRAFDQVQNFLKGNLTVMFPAFHGRNAMSNVVQNFQDIGLRAASPWQQSKAIRLSTGLWKNSAMDIAVVTNTGVKYTYADVHNLIKDYGVLQRMEQRLDLIAIKDVAEATAKTNKVMDTLGKAPKAMRGVGQAIEDQARILNFTSNLERFGDPALAATHSKKFLFDYNDLTPFEKGVMRRLIPFYCVPTSAEILTKNGWKKYNEISIGDIALTYNIDTDRQEWQPIEDIAVFEFDGTLMKIENNYSKFLFTEDHRWPVLDYIGRREIIRAYDLDTSNRIPLSRETEMSNESVLTSKEACLLGWIITDGYFRYKKDSFEAMIYQKKTKTLNRIKRIFKDYITSESIHPTTGVSCLRISTKFTQKIKSLVKTKDDIPSVVTRLNKKALKAMYCAMIEAEAAIDSRNKGEPTIQFVQNNTGVLHAFQIICQLLNKPFSFKKHKNAAHYAGYVHQNNNLKVYKTTGYEEYKGKIWCPKTKNSTWVMRQGGSVIITGNTWQRKNLELQTG
ncbi:MAG: hypothetical protein NT030_06915, partial [Candidatus Saganbacteria bacterium]|nr:hypothetical protein [Candidatus Saganbacteria bacterium]